MRRIILGLVLLLAGCGQGASTSGVSEQASNLFERDVNKYGDLAAAYNTVSGRISKQAWGRQHYCSFGASEGRKYPGLSTASCTVVGAPSKTAPVAPSAAPGIGRVLALQHTIRPGLAVRWPSRVVSINVNTQWARNAAHLWVQQGFNFRMGTGRQIVFAGYSSARNSVGWSQFEFRGGKITQCRIYINPKYLRRYDIANTFAHEMGHCLGLAKGHIGVRGTLMSKFGGARISPHTTAMFNYMYSIKPGGKL